jgi:hypothetical protein
VNYIAATAELTDTLLNRSAFVNHRFVTLDDENGVGKT